MYVLHKLIVLCVQGCDRFFDEFTGVQEAEEATEREDKQWHLV